MFLNVDYYIEVAGRTVMQAGLALALYAQARPIINARRYANFQRFFLEYAAAAAAAFTRLGNYLPAAAALLTCAADGKESLLKVLLAAASAC